LRVEQGLAAKILKAYEVSLEETRAGFARQMSAERPARYRTGSATSAATLQAFLEPLRAGLNDASSCPFCT